MHRKHFFGTLWKNVSWVDSIKKLITNHIFTKPYMYELHKKYIR